MKYLKNKYDEPFKFKSIEADMHGGSGEWFYTTITIPENNPDIEVRVYTKEYFPSITDNYTTRKWNNDRTLSVYSKAKTIFNNIIDIDVQIRNSDKIKGMTVKDHGNIVIQLPKVNELSRIRINEDISKIDKQQLFLKIIELKNYYESLNTTYDVNLEYSNSSDYIKLDTKYPSISDKKYIKADLEIKITNSGIDDNGFFKGVKSSELEYLSASGYIGEEISEEAFAEQVRNDQLIYDKTVESIPESKKKLIDTLIGNKSDLTKNQYKSVLYNTNLFSEKYIASVANDGYKMYVVYGGFTEGIKKFGGNHETKVSGFVSKTDKKIFIEGEFISDVLPHELPHAINNIMIVANSKQFITIYNEEKNKLFPGSDYIDSHFNQNTSEYFAESSNMYLNKYPSLLLNAPKTYKFISNFYK